MKHLIETFQKEIIATVYAKQKFDNIGAPIWVSKEDQIARCVNKVDRFTWYEATKRGYIAVSMTAEEVKILAKFIEEQAQIESDEFVD